MASRRRPGSKFWSTLLAFSLIVSNSVGLPQNIKIGGLFDIWDPYEETAFRHAVERVNGGPNTLKISAQLEKLDGGDSFHASKTVCALLQDGVVGIFGPQTTAALSHVHSICEILGIPHIETKWDFRSSSGSFLLNLYPHPETMKKAYADLMSEWRWGKIIILYESHESLERLQGIFQLTGPGYIATDVVVQQLPSPQHRPGFSTYTAPNNEENIYWPLMKRLKDTYPEYTYVIVDAATDKVPEIMKAADKSGMTKDNYKYFLTSLDIHTLKEEELRYGDVNVTAFRMVNPDDEVVSEVVNSWNLWKVAGRVAFESIPVNYQWYRKQDHANTPQILIPDNMPDLRNGTLRVETALLYDAITLFAGAFQTLLAENQQQSQGAYSRDSRLEIKPVSCDTPIASLYGAGLMSTMKALKFKGLTGIIDIDADGFRRDITLDVMEMNKKGYEKIGEWTTRAIPPFTWTRSIEDTKKLQTEDLKRANFTVASVLTDPYFMINATDGSYTGFVVDLMDTLRQNLGFRYTFKQVGEHGAKKEGRWTGCIGEILNDTVDLCIGDMSITYDRGNVIDFTTPFMNLGISILYTKPFKKPSFIFSFLQPFHSDVWIYMATAYLGVSLILFILARVTPDEWQSDELGRRDTLENQFTLLNALWFAIGSMMGQGSDVLPKAASTRMVAGIWWFFTLIMISSYTANLAAFLTSEGLEEGIKDISDLPKQSKVKYGTLQTGSTFRFFQESSFPLYMEIFKNMEAMKPKPYASSSAKGREMVEKQDGRYAFFMESVSIEYVTERYCKLTQLGGLLDQKGYGIGLKKGSKFRDVFTTQVLNLSENGVIEQLKNKWWKTPEHGGGKCQKEAVSSGGAQALTMSHVGGVFVVLLGGCVLAIIMAFVEFFWKARKLALQGGKSVWAEIGKELKFALLCQGETKPIRKRESLNPTLNSEAESARYLVGSVGTGGGGGGTGNNMTRNSSLDQKE